MTQFLISCKESRIENKRSFYGSFSLGPFEGGQSLTIANALRRTLLSELKGLAIVSVQIEGVLHEYSSLSGIKESVLDILLNLKEIHFCTNWTAHNKRSMLPQIGYLRVRGPGIVRASDLKLPPFIQLVDPEQYIATLAEDGFLNMKFVISEGKNYIIQKASKRNFSSQSAYSQLTFDGPNFQKRRLLLRKIKQISGLSFVSKIKKPLNQIKKNYADFSNSNPLNLDAVFAPVSKVNYIIEYSEHKTIDTSFSHSKEINELLNFLKPLAPVTELEGSHDFFSSKSLKIAKYNTSRTFNHKIQNPFFDLSTFTALSDRAEKGEFIIKDGHNGEKRLYNSLNEILEIKNQLTSINFSQERIIPSSIKHNIIIEIWTNGSIHPREALYQGLEHLVKIFSKLYNIPGILKTPRFNTSSGVTKKLKGGNLEKSNRVQKIFTTSTTNLTPLNNNLFSSNYTALSNTPSKDVY